MVICICICYNYYWYFSQCLSLFVKSHNDYLCLPQPICNYHNHIFIFVVILPSYFHFQLDAYSNVQYFLGHSSIYKGEEHIIPGLWALFNILNRWRCIQAPIPLYPTKLSLFLCIKSNLAPDFLMRWPMH